VSRVSEDEVLLVWRAVRAYRSGRAPGCVPRGRPARSDCPMFDRCERWMRPDDDDALSLAETVEETERRRAQWPCSRLLDVLGPDVVRLGYGRGPRR